jgi:hypothetical protein
MKQDYSIKDILNAVDDILKVKSSQELKKEIKNEIPVKDIFNAADNILKIKPIQQTTKKIINESSVKNDNKNKFINKLESQKKNEMKKKYDLLVINNAKDVLILNRIIFK